MLELATMNEWWRLNARYPEFRKPSHAMLKDFGYMKLMDLVDEVGPRRLLEFGHGFNSTLLARCQDRCEVFALDDYQGLPYFPPLEDWEQMYDEYIRKPCPNATLVRGLLGADDPLPQLEPETFDLIVSVSVLEELPREAFDPVVSHAARLLAPGGLFAGTFDVMLKWPNSINPLVQAIRNAGLELETPEPNRLAADFNELLIESPSTVMITYQMAEGDTRKFNGHWSSAWFVARKPA
ncbi:MAG: class I SAM-dependent methyltransferase [Phycisphaerales bacterium]